MADAMTPRDALAALTDLPHYEERLTARTAGLTSMVWGIGGAAIFLTYATASDLIEARQVYWLYALLWMPWVAAGIATTGALWRSQSLSLRRNPAMAKGFTLSLGYTLLFLVLAGTAFVGLQLVGNAQWTTHSVMAVANGLFGVALGFHQMRTRSCGGRAILVAGVAMLVGGAALGMSGLGDDASALLGAALIGAAWFTAGLVTYRQG